MLVEFSGLQGKSKDKTERCGSGMGLGGRCVWEEDKKERVEGSMRPECFMYIYKIDREEIHFKNL